RCSLTGLSFLRALRCAVDANPFQPAEEVGLRAAEGLVQAAVDGVDAIVDRHRLAVGLVGARGRGPGGGDGGRDVVETARLRPARGAGGAPRRAGLARGGVPRRGAGPPPRPPQGPRPPHTPGGSSPPPPPQAPPPPRSTPCSAKFPTPRRFPNAIDSSSAR